MYTCMSPLGQYAVTVLFAFLLFNAIIIYYFYCQLIFKVLREYMHRYHLPLGNHTYATTPRLPKMYDANRSRRRLEAFE